MVEEPSHLMVIESAFPGVYRYHILHGVINPIEGIGPEEIRIPEMKERIAREGIRELIIATNPTIEGNTTAHYIAEMTKSFDVKITRIASGIPIGGDIVYIDPLTIKSALDNRRSLKEGRIKRRRPTLPTRSREGGAKATYHLWNYQIRFRYSCHLDKHLGL